MRLEVLMVSQKVRPTTTDKNRLRHQQLNLRIGRAKDMGRIMYSTVPKYSMTEPSGWLRLVGVVVQSLEKNGPDTS